MLNEWKEYQQYTQAEPSVPRLKYKQLKDGFSGLNRAFVTIARRFLFDADTHEVTAYTKQVTRYALEIWCGGKGSNMTDAPQEVEALRNVLPDYIKQTLLASKMKAFWKNQEKLPKEFADCVRQIDRTQPKKEHLQQLSALKETYLADYKQIIYNYICPIENCLEMLEDLSNRRKRFGAALFENGNQDNSKNDLHAISYEKEMAKAYAKGELRRYYLCCDDQKIVNGILSKLKNAAKIDCFLKTAAVCCFGCLHTQNQSAVYSKVDLVNWLARINDLDACKPETLPGTDGQPLFAVDSIDKLQVYKLTASDIVRKHFSVIEESALSEWLAAHPKGIFYADPEDEAELTERRYY